MNLTEAEATLAELASSKTSGLVEVGRRGLRPHEYAYVKLTSAVDPEDFAIVSTPGVGWFELEIAGGYRVGRADDLATDDDVREYLEGYIRAAIAYLEGHRLMGASRLFRTPFVTVQADDVTLKLVLSIRGDLKHTFKP